MHTHQHAVSNGKCTARRRGGCGGGGNAAHNNNNKQQNNKTDRHRTPHRPVAAQSQHTRSVNVQTHCCDVPASSRASFPAAALASVVRAQQTKTLLGRRDTAHDRAHVHTRTPTCVHTTTYAHIRVHPQKQNMLFRATVQVAGVCARRASGGRAARHSTPRLFGEGNRTRHSLHRRLGF